MESNLRLLFSVEDAATILSISRRSVFNLINRGDLPVVKIGRRTLVKRDGLFKLAKQGTK
ncbi:MAG: helix-turn-helix domain-containing protein [candidate division Zixibacteria bacterium]|nr:helix-turn-helix domain-containing protein [candidate division Zixibacteria bacterium]